MEQQKKKYTSEERKEIIKKIEKITERPYKDFYLFAAEWLKGYGKDACLLYSDNAGFENDNDFAYAVTDEEEREEDAFYAEEDSEFNEEDNFMYNQEEKTSLTSKAANTYAYEDSDVLKSLDDDATAMITDIFQHDEPELQQNAVMIVMVALRYYIRSRIMRYKKWDDDHREDYLSTAYEVVQTGLQEYDSTRGKLTTYLEPRLRKALGIQCTNDKQLSSRSNNDLMKIINKCKEYAATHLENDNPTPDILYEIAVRVFKRKSLNKQSMINAIKWQPVLVSSNEDENLLNNVKSTFGNPEEEYEKKERVERIRKVINLLPPVQRCVILCCMQYQKETDKDTLPSDVILKEMVSRTFPGITDTEIQTAKKAAKNTMERNYLRKSSRYVEFFPKELVLYPNKRIIEQEAAIITESIERLTEPELEGFFFSYEEVLKQNQRAASEKKDRTRVDETNDGFYQGLCMIN